MGYVHIEVEPVHYAKRGGVCGDLHACHRTAAHTTLMCVDGLGSGIKANVAAQLCASRFMSLVEGGFSLREAFARVVKTMNQARGVDLPFAAFSVARVLNDGEATILCYEAPPPLFVAGDHASALNARTMTLERAVVSESNCYLEPGEGLLLMSDGITQAGLGRSMKEGWGTEGARRFLQHRLSEGTPLWRLPQLLLQQALSVWGEPVGDDISAVLATCRWGKSVNILTGPPSVETRDRALVGRFMRLEGAKIICGASTAKLVARQLGQSLEVEQDASSLVAPPRYFLEGVNLVTEGAITLNQVFNILEEDPASYEGDTGVTQLSEHLIGADRVHILMGGAHNPATDHISFRQRGILPRKRIVPLLAEKLRASGKLVIVEEI